MSDVNTKPLGTNPKDLQGAKKVRLSLVPASSIIYQAQAMEDGARKYGPFNWRHNKVIASIYVDAALRHLLAFFDGETLAKDSKKPHLGHALACIGIIVDALETGNLIDDRPSVGVAGDLIERLTRKEVAVIEANTGDTTASAHFNSSMTPGEVQENLRKVDEITRNHPSPFVGMIGGLIKSVAQSQTLDKGVGPGDTTLTKETA